ncbi:hypothetical protein [uncultured Fibrobacter sp.]|uniref:hypothetical protein n=1 Tax=uncultured Fibrobacter sp. TaxID=261512 RepID=UPI0025D8D29D|nr:hypothetical protein [uncultured Fibrobacter sp.]
MKKMIALLFLPICMFGLAACSDSVFGTDARYKLYPTQNVWTFLKLDTETGRIWQVQYSVKGNDTRFEVPLNPGNIAKAMKRSQKAGRYALFPTQNMYNFIMLDQIDGDTYQVQWGNAENRMLMQISK